MQGPRIMERVAFNQTTAVTQLTKWGDFRVFKQLFNLCLLNTHQLQGLQVSGSRALSRTRPLSSGILYGKGWYPVAFSSQTCFSLCLSKFTPFTLWKVHLTELPVSETGCFSLCPSQHFLSIRTTWFSCLPAFLVKHLKSLLESSLLLRFSSLNDIAKCEPTSLSSCHGLWSLQASWGLCPQAFPRPTRQRRPALWPRVLDLRAFKALEICVLMGLCSHSELWVLLWFYFRKSVEWLRKLKSFSPNLTAHEIWIWAF